MGHDMIDPENLSPYGPQNAPVEIYAERKLRLIRGLTAEELEGWIKCVKFTGRPYLPGERAALTERAKDLGVKL